MAAMAARVERWARPDCHLDSVAAALETTVCDGQLATVCQGCIRKGKKGGLVVSFFPLLSSYFVHAGGGGP